MSVSVVVDSTADIPDELVQRYGISVVPLNVHFGDEVFRDKLDIDTESFYGRLESVTQLPTTSQPSVGAFQQVYSSLPQDRGIISVHLSSNLSGTFQAASMAAADFGGRVRVIDSGSISMGIGFLALTAAEHGGDLDEVERALRERVPRVRLYCVLDTLKYVVMGGRVSRAKAAAGGMLRLKPLMELVDGEIEQVGLARGFDKGLERIVELVDAAGPIERLAVIHGAAPEAAARLEDLLAARFSEMQVITGQIGPVVGTHAGPGAVGAIIVKGG